MDKNLKDIYSFIAQTGLYLLLLALVFGLVCHTWSVPIIRYIGSFILAYGTTLELYAVLNCKKIATLESETKNDQK